MIMPMADRGNGAKGRLVYSTDVGRVCPGCGRPASNCTCSQKAVPNDSIPHRIVAKLRVEKRGRGAKTVTIVDGLPRKEAFLKNLCQELKRGCGTGGTVIDSVVELQGDLRERVRESLLKKGFAVKG
jgi:translation initiation factor 1